MVQIGLRLEERSSTDIEKLKEASHACVYIVYALPFTVRKMGHLGVNKGLGYGHGGVLSCSWAFVKVVNALGERVKRACCHRSKMGLSAGELLPMCNMRLEEVGMGCAYGVG